MRLVALSRERSCYALAGLDYIGRLASASRLLAGVSASAWSVGRSRVTSSLTCRRSGADYVAKAVSVANASTPPWSQDDKRSEPSLVSVCMWGLGLRSATGVGAVASLERRAMIGTDRIMGGSAVGGVGDEQRRTPASSSGMVNRACERILSGPGGNRFGDRRRVSRRASAGRGRRARAAGCGISWLLGVLLVLGGARAAQASFPGRNGRLLVTNYYHGFPTLWAVAARGGRPRRILTETACDDTITTPAFDPSGKVLALGMPREATA